MSGTKKTGPGKAPASARETRAPAVEGGSSGVPPRVGSISTRAVTTVGTEEASKAASKVPAQEPTRRSTRMDTKAVPKSVIPTSKNYYGGRRRYAEPRASFSFFRRVSESHRNEAS